MGMTEIAENRSCFTGQTYRHLSSCLKDFETGRFFSSAMRAAVFIEALLRDILSELDSDTPLTGDAGKLLSELNSIIYRGDLSDSDEALFKVISVKCREVINKNIGIIHDSGEERERIDADARDINNSIIQIAGKYCETGAAARIKSRNSKAGADSGISGEPDFPIFISSITPHTFEQEEFISSFCEKLREIGVLPVRCTFTDFDKKDPMGKVRSIIGSCNALIVIGLERSHAYYYKDKEGSPKESENVHRKYTSGWLHIESGMAIALNKEVFVLCQKDIHSDGIFDRDWNSCTPIEIDSPLDIDHPGVKLMLEKVKEFVGSYGDKTVQIRHRTASR